MTVAYDLRYSLTVAGAASELFVNKAECTDFPFNPSVRQRRDTCSVGGKIGELERLVNLNIGNCARRGAAGEMLVAWDETVTSVADQASDTLPAPQISCAGVIY